MTTLAEATAAAKVYKDTQPGLDSVKEIAKANEAAKKVLGAYMVPRGLKVFRGVTLKLVEFDGWDEEKLRAHLAGRLAEFRRKAPRKFFGLAPARARKRTRKGVEESAAA